MKQQPQNIYEWTALVWLVGMMAHLIWTVQKQYNQPPTDEFYTQLLSFQVAGFALTIFPYWLGALLVILIIEFVIFGRKKE